MNSPVAGENFWKTFLGIGAMLGACLVFLWALFSDRLQAHEVTGVHPHAVHQSTLERAIRSIENRISRFERLMEKRFDKLEERLNNRDDGR